MTHSRRFAITASIAVPYAAGSFIFCQHIYHVCGYAISGTIFGVIIAGLFAYNSIVQTLSTTNKESFWTNLILGAFFWSVYAICGNLFIIRFVEDCRSTFFPPVLWAGTAIAVYVVTAELQKLEL
ncbi:MAG: hypothetical protein Q8Q94_03060 [bacterium]|nr:hypothetical protein [bacterium]MDZ4299510.1 hypothetical protein [Candidatus Sungbacteria bacterium]